MAPDSFDYKKAAKLFDSLVELVPAKYYLDTGEEHVNLRFLKRSVRDEAKAALKQQGKQAKRAKLDPETAKTTLQLQKELAAKQQQQGEGAAESDDDGGSDDGEPQEQQTKSVGAPGMQLRFATGKAPSREELRERLQKKLEGLRQQRKAEESAAKAQAAKEWRDAALAKGRQKVQKAKREEREEHAVAVLKAASEEDSAMQKRRQKQHGQQQQQQKRKLKDGDGDDGTALEFTRVDFGADASGRHGKKKKQSKAALLAAAEEKAARLTALQAAGGAQGKAAAEREAWGSALQRAEGKKVLDDAKLLRKSIKKEAKLKAKKAQAWQERVKQQHEQQASKQQKRRDNIQGRIEKKAEKLKERREKRLLRAGFEGRKEGFISTAPSPAAGKR